MQYRITEVFYYDDGSSSMGFRVSDDYEDLKKDFMSMMEDLMVEDYYESDKNMSFRTQQGDVEVFLDEVI